MNLYRVKLKQGLLIKKTPKTEWYNICNIEETPLNIIAESITDIDVYLNTHFISKDDFIILSIKLKCTDIHMNIVNKPKEVEE
jgi:hypothetical protein